MIQGIHHIAIKCKDIDQFNETVAFYRDLLGLTECLKWDGGVMLDTGAGRLEIIPHRRRRQGTGCAAPHGL